MQVITPAAVTCMHCRTCRVWMLALANVLITSAPLLAKQRPERIACSMVRHRQPVLMKSIGDRFASVLKSLPPVHAGSLIELCCQVIAIVRQLAVMCIQMGVYNPCTAVRHCNVALGVWVHSGL